MRAFPLLTGLVLLACTPACSGDDPDDPNGDNGGNGSVDPIDEIASAEIGPEGGVITAGPAVLTVPPGALAAPTTLTVEISSNTDDVPVSGPRRFASPMVTLTPHGQAFDADVTLTFPYTVQEFEQGVLRRADEAATTWSPVQADLSAGTATVEMQSFSYYAVFSTVPAGGITFYITAPKSCEWINLVVRNTSARLRGTSVASDPLICGDVSTGTTVQNIPYGTVPYSATCDDDQWSGFVELDEPCKLQRVDE